LCGGRRRLQFSNLLSPLKLDPQDELMLVQQRLEFGPLPADAFFFEGHAFGEESSACADSHEEQVNIKLFSTCFASFYLLNYM
jgi:hypothetical protein